MDEPRQWEDLLESLERDAQKSAKQRAQKISVLVDEFCVKAYSEGLPASALSQVVDIVTRPNSLDQASLGRLIKNLYPASKVPDAVVSRVVASLGHGRAKTGYAAQAALLRWLVMIYEVLENQKVLTQLYGVLFNLLDTIAIRPQLCHVLSLITRRKHVRPFRIQALMETTRQAGHEPPLVGLMRVYKDYYPDVIVGDVTSGRATAFTHPDPEWRDRLAEIQEAHRDAASSKNGTFRVARSNQAKVSLIPEVRTYHAHASSTTLEEIEDVDDFVRKLEKIELPNQLVAVISDPLLQKFLQLKSSKATARRIDYWLLAFFEDQVESGAQAEKDIREMLRAICSYTRFTKTLPPACMVYLKSVIPTWNGVTNRDIVLDLLSYTAIGSWEDLYPSIFQPLEEALLDDTTNSLITVLNFYTSLLNHWSTSLLTTPSLPTTTNPTLTALFHHTNTLCLTLLQHASNPLTHHPIVHHYTTYTSLLSHPTLRSLLRITIPSAPTVYTLLFTPSLSILSSLCTLLSTYKRAFEHAMSLPPTVAPHSYPKEYVNHFNGFLMDICNLLWRSKAFNTSDTNALGCLLAPSVAASLSSYTAKLDPASNISLNTLFSLSYSPLLCALSIAWLRELEEKEGVEERHAGPVTQASLNSLAVDGGVRLSFLAYRLGVLGYLKERGADGVEELMFNTMKHLMAKGQRA